MFAECSSLVNLSGISTWNIANATTLQGTFSECSSLTDLNDLSSWDTSKVSSMNNLFFGCTGLTDMTGVTGWNTANTTSVSSMFRECTSLTTLNISNWNTSKLIQAKDFARDSSSLTNVILSGGTGNPLSVCPSRFYNDAFTNTNLSQQSIDDILVAINAANTSNGTFNQSGGSAPSVTGEAAIDALRGRGWTITVTGGY